MADISPNYPEQDKEMSEMPDQIESIYQRANSLTGGTLAILRRAGKRFNKTRAPEAAASIAYYALFSLFPFLLFLIAGSSFILKQDVVQAQVLNYIQSIIPVSQNVIIKNIQRVLEERSTFGVIALVSLLWSGTGVFNTLAVNINRAWKGSQTRNFLESRLIALGMVGVLVGLLVLSQILTTLLDLLPQIRVPIFGTVTLYETLPWIIFSNLLPLLFRLVMLWALYLWVPDLPVQPRAAFWGALVATLGWEVVTAGFTWYLGSGFARYELIYGSLGTIVILMFWIYLSSWIILFGAHLAASIAQPSNETSPEPTE